MTRICYVAHRYYPFPGGTEYYVRDLAEETLKQGNQAYVFAGQHQGDQNGVKVTDDPRILRENWDLIVVHGCGVPAQDFVLKNAQRYDSPVLFLIVRPEETSMMFEAMENAQYIGCSTRKDWEFVRKYKQDHKAVPVPHSINLANSNGNLGFRQKYNISTKFMFLSSGGYWEHKNHLWLAEQMNEIAREDVTMVFTGYHKDYNQVPAETPFVTSFLFDDRQEVLNAIKEADLYILPSKDEGFGLVLLEAMWNETPWASFDTAGAETLTSMRGAVFEQNVPGKREFKQYLADFDGKPKPFTIRGNKKFVQKKRSITKAVECITSLANTSPHRHFKVNPNHEDYFLFGYGRHSKTVTNKRRKV